MQITLDIPDGHLKSQTASQLGQQLKLYAALFLFQTGQLSRGAACEFAGTDIYTFLEACKQYQIPVINYPASELAVELARFNNRRHPK
jgi:predicted HTH domain antitoxin